MMPLKQKHILLSTYAHSIMHFTIINAYMYVCVYIYSYTQSYPKFIYYICMYTQIYTHEYLFAKLTLSDFISAYFLSPSILLLAHEIMLFFWTASTIKVWQHFLFYQTHIMFQHIEGKFSSIPQRALNIDL